MGTLTSRLFEPDIIVPSQFFATLRRYAPRKRAEYRLLVAVLKEAIECFQENAPARNKWQQRCFDEVQRWITGEDRDAVSHEDQVPGFSFEYVCDVLGLDAISAGVCSGGLHGPVRSRTRSTPRADVTQLQASGQ